LITVKPSISSVLSQRFYGVFQGRDAVAFRRRQKVLDEALALAAERGTPLKDLLISITAARQA
jgi:hypothetical protein